MGSVSSVCIQLDSPVKAQNLYYINVLRGLAILLVIWVHHSQSFSALIGVKKLAHFGRYGVQLFFVCSALTLCISAERRKNDSYAYLKFLIRRLCRIAPMYWFGIVLYTIIAFSTLAQASHLDYSYFNFTNIAANILFLHGFMPSANNTIVPGGWSIGVEMLFYIAFPAIYLLATKVNQFLGEAGVWLLAALALGINLSLQPFLAIAFNDEHNFAYYSLINQLPVFIIGVALWFSLGKAESQLNLVKNLLWMVGFFVLLVVFEKLNWWQVGPTVAGVAFYFLAKVASRLANFPSLLARIGTLSYSMYVTHFIFAWVATSALSAVVPKGPIWQFALYVVSYPLVVVLTYYVAALTKILIEDRGVSFGQRLIERWPGESAH